MATSMKYSFVLKTVTLVLNLFTLTFGHNGTNGWISVIR